MGTLPAAGQAPAQDGGGDWFLLPARAEAGQEGRGGATALAGNPILRNARRPDAPPAPRLHPFPGPLAGSRHPRMVPASPTSTSPWVLSAGGRSP